MFSLSKFLQPNVDKLKAKGDVNGLIKALSYQKDSSIRLKAARALGGFKTPQVIIALTNALQDKDLFVKEVAVDALGQIGNTDTIKPLAIALKNPDWRVRKRAEKALSHSTPNWTKLEDVINVVPNIIAELKTVSTVNEEAVELLGVIGDPRSITPMLSLLQVANKARYNARPVGVILKALENILRQTDTSVPSNDLEKIAGLPNFVVRSRKETDYGTYDDHEENLDTSFLRNLARQRLGDR